MNKHTTINAIMNIINAPNRLAEWNTYDKAEQIWELFEPAKNLRQSVVIESVCDCISPISGTSIYKCGRCGKDIKVNEQINRS